MDATSVYWTTLGTGASDGEVTKVPRAGGTPVTLAYAIAYGGFAWMSSCLPHVALDDTSVYWNNVGTLLDSGYANDGTISKVPPDGGKVTELASALVAPCAIATDGTNVYWDTLASPSGAVLKVAREGGIPTTLAPFDGREGLGLAIDDVNVYGTRAGSEVNSGELLIVPKNGGPVTTVASGTRPQAVAVDGESIFWLDIGLQDGPFRGYHHASISEIPKVAPWSTPTTLAFAITSDAFSRSTIAIDDENVYWVDTGSSSIMKVSKQGGEATAVVTVKPPRWAAP